MTTWAVHLMLASGLLAGAARLGESALQPLGRPVRGIWLAALLGVFLLPAATRYAASPAEPVVMKAAVSAEEIAAPADRVAAAVRQASGFAIPVTAPVERAVTATWLLSSGAVGLGLVALLTRLAFAGRRWPRRRLDGTEVLVSPDEGPAVIGVMRARIVVPAWLLASSPAERSLILAHEREHAAAGDQRLLALGFLLVCLAPWNPVLWWMLLRLRLAVEMDCDRRVLRASRDVRAYGAMLLGVAGRSHAPALSAAFIEPASFLRQRIVAMTARRPRHALLRGGVLAGLAAGLVLVACEMAPPTELSDAREETEIPASLSVPPEVEIPPSRARGEFVAEADGGLDTGLPEVAEPVVEEELTAGLRQRVRIADPEGNGLGQVELRLRATAIEAPRSGQAGSPLIYVDGVRATGDVMRELDPDRIERVEVIKGPAAARVIGAHAAAGVVQITTKGAAGGNR